VRWVEEEAKVESGSRVVIKSVRPCPVLAYFEQVDYTRDMVVDGGGSGSEGGDSGGW